MLWIFLLSHPFPRFINFQAVTASAATATMVLSLTHPLTHYIPPDKRRLGRSSLTLIHSFFCWSFRFRHVVYGCVCWVGVLVFLAFYITYLYCLYTIYTYTQTHCSIRCVYTHIFLYFSSTFRLATWTWLFHQILSLKIPLPMLLSRKEVLLNWPAGSWLSVYFIYRIKHVPSHLLQYKLSIASL